MQSLGKVPSARRPPANLPSLKAETSIPTEQQGTWGGSDTNQLAASSAVGTNLVSSTSTTTAPVSIGGTVNVNSINTTNQLHSNQTNTVAAIINNSSNSNNIATGKGNQSITSTSSSSSGSTTWSSVATGGVQETAAQPPLYQSPQFQNEFPSLDGAVQLNTANSITGNKQNRGDQVIQQTQQNTNLTDGAQLSLRPQTDAAIWMQQQQQQGVGGGNRGENQNSQNSQQIQSGQPLPPQLRALMPQFMYRSGGGGGAGSGGGQSGIGGINSSNSNTGNYGFQQQTQSQQSLVQQSNYMAIQARNRSQHGGPLSHSNEPHSGVGPNRRPLPHRHITTNNSNNSRQDEHNRSSLSSLSNMESDALMQRPIIREEELERIETIAKDEGWAKHDEIDYNQKLQFSDDDTLDTPPVAYNSKSIDLQRNIENKKSSELKKQEQDDNRTGNFNRFYD